MKEIVKPNERQKLQRIAFYLMFQMTRKALTLVFDLLFNLFNPASACASGAAGMEIWRLCGREGQDSPAATELQISDRKGEENANCIFFLQRIIIQEICGNFNLSFYFGLGAAGEGDLQMAN